MRRRWIIRSFFLLPILFCMAGWVWSGTHFSFIIRFGDGGFIACFTRAGVIDIVDERDIYSINSSGWHWHSRQVPVQFWPDDMTEFRSVLGFGIHHNADETTSGYTLTVPYWFLIVLFSVIFLLIYRKTCPKPNPQTAFPVEVGGISERP